MSIKIEDWEVVGWRHEKCTGIMGQVGQYVL